MGHTTELIAERVATPSADLSQALVTIRDGIVAGCVRGRREPLAI
jgi:hypothetical protein